jgi:hypothetical protein
VTLFTRRNDQLNNHVATVTDYINAYGEAKDENTRNSYFSKFTKYIVCCCWRKMRRRILHWSSQGFIWSLGQISDITVEQSCISNANNIPFKRDISLGNLLRRMGDAGINEILSNHAQPPGNEESSQNLLSTLRAAFQNALQNNTSTSPYNKDTCVEFHHLLVSALLAFGKTLAQFSEHSSNESFLKLFRVTLLLWRLGHSWALRHHLSALEAGGALFIPNHEMKTLYFVYTKFGSFNETDDDVDNELQRLSACHQPDGPKKGLALIFQRWMRLQVIPFAATDILSAFSRRNDGNDKPTPLVEISLFAVRRPGSTPISWRSMVESLTGDSESNQPSSAFHAAAAIDVIEYHIKTSKDSRSIFKAFQSEDVRFYGNIHCEAALASLVKFPKLVGSTDERVLTDIFSVRSHLYSVTF